MKIGLVPVPGFALLSYACTVEPLRAANLLAGRVLYDIVHFGAGAVPSSGATTVAADCAIGDAVALDLLLVVAGGAPETFSDATTLRWLGRLARQGLTLGGVSGGPVILARAGVMAGYRMTVHWEHAAALAEHAPDMAIERSLFVIDRDRVTCGGGTAPLDLMHALIARDHGAGFAQKVSDWFLHTDIRPSGGPQRAGLVERLGTVCGPVLDAVAAMESHISDPLSLSQLAQVVGVSSRQLGRLFDTHLGTAPMAYYRRLRLETAQRLLRQSPMTVTEIALATGFAGSAHFSTAFAAHYGAPPSKARQ